MTQRIRIAALLLAGVASTPAVGQLAQSGPAVDFYNAQIRNQAVGTGYSVNSTLRNDLASTRIPGISNFQLTTGTASSGAGRTSASTSIPLTGGGLSGSKPFSNITRSPTVSPFLNLFNTGIGGTSSSFDNYNTLVRPQLDQQRTNRQLQLQNQKLNQRVQQISAQPAFQAQGSDRIMATGHSTVFGYYGRFYPSKNVRRR